MTNEYRWPRRERGLLGTCEGDPQTLARCPISRYRRHRDSGRSYRIGLLALFLLLASLAARAESDSNIGNSSDGSRSPTPAYSVEHLRAHLFFGRSGTIGTDDVAQEASAASINESSTPLPLYHAIAGENSTQGPSNQLVAIVTLSEARGLSSHAQGVLEFTARGAKGKILNSYKVDLWKLGFAHAQGEHHVPFVVYGTGCVPVSLEARLRIRDRGKVIRSALKRIVPFRCDE